MTIAAWLASLSLARKSGDHVASAICSYAALLAGGRGGGGRACDDAVGGRNPEHARVCGASGWSPFLLLTSLAELHEIAATDTEIAIGAAVTHNALVSALQGLPDCRSLVEAARRGNVSDGREAARLLSSSAWRNRTFDFERGLANCGMAARAQRMKLRTCLRRSHCRGRFRPQFESCQG